MFYVFYFILLIPVFAGMWGMFVKAGQPGWAAIVPIYNGIVMLEITGKPLWWIVLFFIPCVNVIMGIIMAIELANRFGKGGGFVVGMILLPFVFYPILGFGDARYIPPGREGMRRRPRDEDWEEEEDDDPRPRRRQ